MHKIETLDSLLLDLKWGIERSIRYHDRRRQFFRYLSLACSLMCVISSVLLSILLPESPQDNFIKQNIIPAFLIVLFIAGFMAYLLVKVEQYDQLYLRFINLEKDIMTDSSPSVTAVQCWTLNRFTIEMNEPPVLKILDMMCHNELLRAKGYDNSMQVKITWLQRLFAHFFDYKEYTIQPSEE